MSETSPNRISLSTLCVKSQLVSFKAKSLNFSMMESFDDEEKTLYPVLAGIVADSLSICFLIHKFASFHFVCSSSFSSFSLLFILPLELILLSCIFLNEICKRHTHTHIHTHTSYLRVGGDDYKLASYWLPNDRNESQ